VKKISCGEEKWYSDVMYLFSGITGSPLNRGITTSPTARIESISPVSGGVGTEVTVRGQNLKGATASFIPKPGESGKEGVVTYSDATTLKVKVPSGLIGSVFVQVRTSYGPNYSSQTFTPTEMSQKIAEQAVIQREGDLTVDLQAQKAARDALEKERTAFTEAQKVFQQDQTTLIQTQEQVRQAQIEAQATQAQIKRFLMYGGVGGLALMGVMLFLKWKK